MWIYPKLEAWPNMPLAARMMLEGDGSTTLMLQILLGSRLQAEPVNSDNVGVEAADSTCLPMVFAPHEHSDLGVRRARLRDHKGDLVSENLIVYRNADLGTLIPTDGTPFGVHTRRLGLYERRRIFCHGITRSEFGLIPMRAPGRVYEIRFSPEQRVLVHEAINPTVVSTMVRNDSDRSTPTERRLRYPAGRMTRKIAR